MTATGYGWKHTEMQYICFDAQHTQIVQKDNTSSNIQQHAGQKSNAKGGSIVTTPTSSGDHPLTDKLWVQKWHVFLESSVMSSKICTLFRRNLFDIFISNANSEDARICTNSPTAAAARTLSIINVHVDCQGWGLLMWRSPPRRHQETGKQYRCVMWSLQYLLQSLMVLQVMKNHAAIVLWCTTRR